MNETTSSTDRQALRDVRIGSTDHFTLSATNMEPGASTLCGKLIAGTPVSPNFESVCDECMAKSGCDECDHGVGTTGGHVWAPAFEREQPEVARFIYDNATCWSEHICRECSPELYAQALQLAGLTAEQLH